MHGGPCVWDMTNWMTIYLPRSLSPIVDFNQLWDEEESLFTKGFDKYSIVPLLHPQHPDIADNKARRWRMGMAALSEGTFFNRPNYQPDTPYTVKYRDPIFDVRQSSEAHVKSELDIMRSHPYHAKSKIFFVGGDGLAIMRINTILARQGAAAEYLMKAPAVVPVQGEHPHGTCHVLHMGWRPYWPLLEPMLKGIGHTWMKKEFKVSDFNQYDFVMCILIAGIAKYLHKIAAAGHKNVYLGDSFGEACAANPDLNWMFHFLHDHGMGGTLSLSLSVCVCVFVCVCVPPTCE